jgi:hypothetical protein
MKMNGYSADRLSKERAGGNGAIMLPLNAGRFYHAMPEPHRSLKNGVDSVPHLA